MSLELLNPYVAFRETDELSQLESVIRALRIQPEVNTRLSMLSAQSEQLYSVRPDIADSVASIRTDVEDPPFVNFGKPQLRADTVSMIVNTYKNLPEVISAIDQLFGFGKNDRHRHFFPSTDSQIDHDARAYRQLLYDPHITNGYFKCIDRALAKFVSMKGKNTSSIPIDEVFTDMTIAYQTMFLTSLPIATYYLKKMQFQGKTDRVFVQNADILQASFSGLLDAVQRFDYTIGQPFWSYAEPWIRSAVQTSFRTERTPVVLSHDDEQKWLKIRRLLIDNLNQGKSFPEYKEIATNLGLDIEEVAGIVAKELGTIYLDDDYEKSDTLPDDVVSYAFEPAPLRSIYNEVAHANILRIIEAADLTATQMAAVSLKYGVYLERLSGQQIGVKEVDYDAAFEEIGSTGCNTNADVAKSLNMSISNIGSAVTVGMKCLQNAAYVEVL